MRTRARTVGALLTGLVLSLSLPLTALAAAGDLRSGDIEPGPVRSVEPAGDCEPEPATDRTSPTSVEPIGGSAGERPILPEDRCQRLAENPRRCLDQVPSRGRCLEWAESPRRCLQDQDPLDRCVDLADNPRRCGEAPSHHNFRQLIWRLIQAHEWRLLIRLFYALGLV